MKKLFGRYRGLPREIYILFVARIINSIGAFVFPLMTLIMTEKLGYTSDYAGLLMTILALTQVPAMLIGGKLSDHFGRKKLIIIFEILGASFFLLCGLLPISDATIYLIIAASNMYAFAHPAMDAMAIDLTNTANRKEAFSLLYMGFNLGFAIGPMIGGLLFAKHLPFVFIGDALTTMASIVLIIIFVRETMPHKEDAKARPELERRQEGSVLRVLWNRKILVVFALVMMVMQFAYHQWSFALPQQMNAVFSDGAKQYGLLASYNGALVIILTPLITTMISKWKALRGTFVGGIMYAISFGMLIFLKDLPWFYVSMFFLTFGEVIVVIDAQAFIANFSPSSHRARLNSVTQMISGTGRMLSPLIIGQVIASYSLSTAWAVVSIAAMSGSVILIGIMKNRKIDQQVRRIGDTVEEAETVTEREAEDTV